MSTFKLSDYNQFIQNNMSTETLTKLNPKILINSKFDPNGSDANVSDPKTLNAELNKVELSNNKKSKHKTCINKLNNRLKIQEKNKKIGHVIVRISPIMEVLTGVMIAILIFYSGKLIAVGELSVNNFFSFLAAMMLAYQPVRSLATLNMSIRQGLSAAKRILPVIDEKNY